MAWGSEITVSNFADLKAQLSASGTADVVKLANDIEYPSNGSDLLNIERSLTLDGQGYKITGWGTCNSNHGGDAYYIITPLAINYGEEASNLDVTLKNISMSTVSNTTTKHEVGLMVMDKVAKLTLKECDIRSHTAKNAANSHGIAFYGETADALELKVENSFVSAGASGYAFSVLKPIDANLLNSTLEGYSSVTFYAPNAYMYAAYKTAKAFGTNNSGSRGTTFYAKSCDFNAPNIHSGVSNAYATFAIQDDGINLTLDNCGIDATQLGDQQQWGVMLSPWTPIARRVQNVNIEFTGDNSHINGTLLYVRWLEAQWDKTALAPEFNSESWAYWGENGISLAGVDHSATRAFSYTGNINVTISGGTYAQNVGELQFPLHVNTAHPSYDSKKFLDADYSATQPEKFIMKDVTIPDDYEVKTITMDGVVNPLYRVVKKAARDGEDKLYDLNDNVQSQGDGQNPTTSFELSTGTDMTLNQDLTKAGYVEVKDNGSSVATTVTVAKNDVNPEQSQTLVINNGLDVQGESQVIVEPTAALVIGEGGIVTSKPENIIIQADEDGAASLLLDPTISVNQTPELTVKMTVPAEHAGYEMHGSDKYRHWHRFAMPVDHMAATWAKEPDVPTYLYGWDYSAQEWAQVGVTEMVPFAGYTLSPDQEITGSNSAVTYTFKGKLLGNTNCTLNLDHHGYNFFGNSYTGYISILKLVDQIMGDAKIDGTVWMWDGETYQGIGLEYLRQYGDIEPSWKKEVAPMQTFVLRLTGDDYSSTDINYADAIWGNPRYDAAKTALNAAPARQAEINDDAIIRMTIEANGQKESVVLIENGVYSDAYDRGYDAIKYMNENCFNTYVGVNGENYGTVATDILEGKMLNIKTNNELAYSITFDFVAGEEYALRDNLTGNVIAIEEGATYEFAAQPNSTIEGRFEIVSVAKMPTAIENTEVKANVKGIYTLTGQYLGENFEALPAGVYVVNGVKIVK